MKAGVVLFEERQVLRADAEGGSRGELLVLTELAVLEQGGG